MYNEPLGIGRDGEPVYLRQIWPSNAEEISALAESLTAEMFTEQYGNVFSGNEDVEPHRPQRRRAVPVGRSSTYIQEPPFFTGLSREVKPITNIKGARVLVKVGDSITTDHISPAGSISRTSPAGQYLINNGVEPRDFNSYGSRRGNDRIMTRGTFANIRLRNHMAPGTEGGMTTYLPTDEVMTIFDASLKYKETNTPLVVLAGREYGTGSSRDWAAKGPLLLGVRLVIAESFERIHRSNLVGMGILPLQFKPGQNPQTLGLDGTETYATVNLSDDLKPLQDVTVRAETTDGRVITFETTCRIDTPVEVDYYRNGGILHTVLRNFLK
jgi:aconitate hydratase